MKQKTIEVLQDFKFAHRGCDVREYAKGDVVEVDEDCFEVACEEKWARAAKAKKSAPENKDAGPAPENKGDSDSEGQ